MGSDKPGNTDRMSSWQIGGVRASGDRRVAQSPREEVVLSAGFEPATPG
jgi:hypothetical protein